MIFKLGREVTTKYPNFALFFQKKWLFFCRTAERHLTRTGSNGNNDHTIRRIVNYQKSGFIGQTAMHDGITNVGVRGNEAVVHPDRKILVTEVIGNDKTIDILTKTLFTITHQTEAPEEEHQHDGKHGHKQHGCARKEGFIGILGFSHGAKIRQKYRI